MQEKIITKQYLREHPNEVFVFGDNTHRKGCGGAAILRYEPNVYGFITKKRPDHRDDSYYRPEEYEGVFVREYVKLHKEIKTHPDKKYLISKLGAGLANKYRIWEKIIEPNLKSGLKHLPNVEFLF
jgi:hypothetical protein